MNIQIQESQKDDLNPQLVIGHVMITPLVKSKGVHLTV
jgi:hypothetical protein